MTENNAAQPGLTTEQILILERRSDMTDDEALRFGRAIESALLSKLRAEGVQAGDERESFSDWAWRKDGLAIGHMDGQAAAWEAWQERARRAALASAPVVGESVCKGSMALGSGCGACERCKAEVQTGSAPVAGEAKRNANGAPPCWWIDHGSHGQITQREDEAQRAADEGKRVVSYTAAPQASEPQPTDERFKPPFDNCSFRMCDLPGQCRGEGKCHHPAPQASEAVRNALAVSVLKMSESNGSVTYCAYLHKVGLTGLDIGINGYQFYRSAVRGCTDYEADCMLFAIGLAEHKPDVLAYQTQTDKDGGDCAKGAGETLAPVFQFLLGEGPLRGVEFGDRHPDERGAYWWRKDLRAALAAQPGAQKGGGYAN